MGRSDVRETAAGVWKSKTGIKEASFAPADQKAFRLRNAFWSLNMNPVENVGKRLPQIVAVKNGPDYFW
jgi:hypothetical protein